MRTDRNQSPEYFDSAAEAAVNEARELDPIALPDVDTGTDIRREARP